MSRADRSLFFVRYKLKVYPATCFSIPTRYGSREFRHELFRVPGH